jgi:hypothetical protein
MKDSIWFITTILVLVFAAPSMAGDSKIQFNENEILKVSVFKSGEIRAEDKVVSLRQLDALLAANAQQKGVVWYYREGGQGEPTPEAMEVIKLVIKHKRPISMSSKPDFSDTIDEKGNSKPRKK